MFRSYDYKDWGKPKDGAYIECDCNSTKVVDYLKDSLLNQGWEIVHANKLRFETVFIRVDTANMDLYRIIMSGYKEKLSVSFESKSTDEKIKIYSNKKSTSNMYYWNFRNMLSKHCETKDTLYMNLIEY